MEEYDSHRGDRVPSEAIDWIGKGPEFIVLQTHLLEGLVVQDVDRTPVVHQYHVYVVVGHHHHDDQSVAVGVLDKVCITFSESDVVVLPLELLCMSLVHAVNIGERPLLRLSDVAFLCPMHFSSEVRSTKDHLDFAWEFCLRSIVLRPGPPVVDVILKVPTANEFLNLILESDVLFSGVTDILVVSAVFILISLRSISMQWVRPLEYPSFLCNH